MSDNPHNALPDSASELMNLYRLRIDEHDGSKESCRLLDVVLRKWTDISVVNMVSASNLDELLEACLYAEPICEEFPVAIAQIFEYELEPAHARWLLAIASRFTTRNIELREKLLEKAGELVRQDEETLMNMLRTLVNEFKRFNKDCPEEDLALLFLPLLPGEKEEGDESA